MKLKVVISRIKLPPLILAALLFAQTILAQHSSPTFPAAMNGEKSINTVLDSIITWQWDSASSAYSKLQQAERYDYSSDNQVISTSQQAWDNGSWLNHWYSTYGYSANSFDTSEVDLLWQNGAWINYDSDHYTYGANNKVSNWQQVLRTNGAWQNYMQFALAYDSLNRPTLQWQMQFVGGIWDTIGVDTYMYDSLGNQVADIYKVPANASWASSFETLEAYDTSHNELSFISMQWLSDTWDSTYRGMAAYDTLNRTVYWVYQEYSNGVWANTDSAHYYYGQPVTGIINEPVNTPYVSVYPNPSKSVINIVYRSAGNESAIASLYDGEGRVMLSQPVTGVRQMDVHQLASGVYQLVLAGENGTRIVKQVVIQ